MQVTGSDGAAVPVDEDLEIARGVVSAIAPDDGGLTEVQLSFLGAILEALTGRPLDLASLEPLDPDGLAGALGSRPLAFRTRWSTSWCWASSSYGRSRPPWRGGSRSTPRRSASTTGSSESPGATPRAPSVWRGSTCTGAASPSTGSGREPTSCARRSRLEHQLAAGVEDRELAECWLSFADLDPGTLGRGVWEMYRSRGFGLPGTVGGASAYLAQHDFVHVLADYGTDLDGELEVFALIGRADPDPKGFAWLATLVGLFETGYVADAGFFTGDLQERHLETGAMHVRIADALRRGRDLCDGLGVDLFEVDFHQLAGRPVPEARAELGLGPKGRGAAGGRVTRRLRPRRHVPDPT